MYYKCISLKNTNGKGVVYLLHRIKATTLVSTNVHSDVEELHIRNAVM